MVTRNQFCILLTIVYHPFDSELRNMGILLMNVERHFSYVGNLCWNLPGNF